VRLLVQDSADAPAYSAKDRLARMGVRTIPKKRQVDEDKTGFFFGYKLHLDANAERKIPWCFPSNQRTGTIRGSSTGSLKE